MSKINGSLLTPQLILGKPAITVNESERTLEGIRQLIMSKISGSLLTPQLILKRPAITVNESERTLEGI
jgi:hypothetical protein